MNCDLDMINSVIAIDPDNKKISDMDKKLKFRSALWKI